MQRTASAPGFRDVARLRQNTITSTSPPSSSTSTPQSSATIAVDEMPASFLPHQVGVAIPIMHAVAHTVGQASLLGTGLHTPAVPPTHLVAPNALRAAGRTWSTPLARMTPSARIEREASLLLALKNSAQTISSSKVTTAPVQVESKLGARSHSDSTIMNQSRKSRKDPVKKPNKRIKGRKRVQATRLAAAASASSPKTSGASSDSGADTPPRPKDSGYAAVLHTSSPLAFRVPRCKTISNASTSSTASTVSIEGEAPSQMKRESTPGVGLHTGEGINGTLASSPSSSSGSLTPKQHWTSPAIMSKKRKNNESAMKILAIAAARRRGSPSSELHPSPGPSPTASSSPPADAFQHAELVHINKRRKVDESDLAMLGGTDEPPPPALSASGRPLRSTRSRTARATAAARAQARSDATRRTVLNALDPSFVRHVQVTIFDRAKMRQRPSSSKLLLSYRFR
jgi:hypothetical protein